MQGTIVSETNHGWWIVEADGTSESIFVHYSQVAGNRYLHVGDRIKFDSEPNPRKTGQNRAVRVEWIGRNIARQKGFAAVQS